MSEPFVVGLAEVGLVDRSRVGGKAVGLGELLRAGLPVPAGFCVTTAAYRRFIAPYELEGLFHSTHRAEADPTETERTLERVRAVLLAAPIPAEVADAVRQAHLAIGDEPLAVRSSATLEDLAEASYAGQQDTFLNVVGLDPLLDALRRCWVSLWNTRAVAYRARIGVKQPQIGMGVVVQVLVPADVAGVLFTANPITGRRDEIVVNASFGLGEAVVSGQVTPDTYVLDKQSLDLKLVELGTKSLLITSADNGGTRVIPAQQSRAHERALSDHQLGVLADLGCRAEAHFGGLPQDVEWAFVGDRCALLQSRPVTALPLPPLEDVRWEPPLDGSVWVRRQVAENLPEPLSPLFEELYLRQGLERSLDALMAFFKMPWLHLEDIADPRFFTTINGFAYQRANFKFGLKALYIALRGTFDGWRVMLSDAVSFWSDLALPTYLATVERWKAADPGALSNEQLLAGVRELAWADATYWYACAVVVAEAKWTDALLDAFWHSRRRAADLLAACCCAGSPRGL